MEAREFAVWREIFENFEFQKTEDAAFAAGVAFFHNVASLLKTVKHPFEVLNQCFKHLLRCQKKPALTKNWLKREAH